MTLGEIVYAYRQEHTMSLDTFAKNSGLSKTYLWMLEKGRNPKSGELIKPSVETIQKVAKAMFMDFDKLFDMLGDTVKIKLDNTVVGKKSVPIPVLGRVAAGIPISAIEDILDYEEISEEMAHTGEFFALKIKGHSMEPKIEDGSIVIVRQQEDAESGNVVIALVNGDDATCKKLIKRDGGILLQPLNPSYEPLFFTEKEMKKLPVKIIGKVIEIRTRCE